MLYQWHSNTPDISQEQRADSSYNSRVERFKANGDFPTATQRFNPQERVWNHQKWWYIREYHEVSIICMTAKTAINDYFNGETISIMAKLIWFLGCTFKCQEDGYCRNCIHCTDLDLRTQKDGLMMSFTSQDVVAGKSSGFHRGIVMYSVEWPPHCNMFFLMILADTWTWWNPKYSWETSQISKHVCMFK